VARSFGSSLDFAKLPTRVWLTLIWAALMALEPGITRAEDSIGLCARCNVMVGVGTTYRLFGWTDGVVVPLTLELDESRWELGAFRMTNAQRYRENDHATNPGLARQAARAGHTPLVEFLDQAAQSRTGFFDVELRVLNRSEAMDHFGPERL
jgi:hypothetical protein